jgi:hypothetical protein
VVALEGHLRANTQRQEKSYYACVFARQTQAQRRRRESEGERGPGLQDIMGPGDTGTDVQPNEKNEDTSGRFFIKLNIVHFKASG